MTTTQTTKTIEIKISTERTKTFMEAVKLVKQCGGTFDDDRKVWTVTGIPVDKDPMAAMDAWTAGRIHFYAAALTIAEVEA
jgi:hypothetical protein